MPTPPLPEIPARHSHWLLDPMVSVLPLAEKEVMVAA